MRVFISVRVFYIKASVVLHDILIHIEVILEIFFSQNIVIYEMLIQMLEENKVHKAVA